VFETALADVQFDGIPVSKNGSEPTSVSNVKELLALIQIHLMHEYLSAAIAFVADHFCLFNFLLMFSSYYHLRFLSQYGLLHRGQILMSSVFFLGYQPQSQRLQVR
jgi:hypothetical protein